MEDAGAPQLGEARQRRHSVVHAVRKQEPAAGDPAAIFELQRERIFVELAGAAGDDVTDLDGRVRLKLLAADAPQIARWGAVLRQEAMHRSRHGVCRSVCVHHEHAPAHSPEHKRSVQAGRAGADDQDVVLVGFWDLVHLALHPKPKSSANELRRAGLTRNLFAILDSVPSRSISCRLVHVRFVPEGAL